VQAEQQTGDNAQRGQPYPHHAGYQEGQEQHQARRCSPAEVTELPEIIILDQQRVREGTEKKEEGEEEFRQPER